MGNAAAEGARAAVREGPVDAVMMRRTTSRLLSPGAEVVTDPKELNDLTLLLRGHIMLLIPEVEAATAWFPDDDVPATCARACLGEARMKLNVAPPAGPAAGIAHSQKLARVLNALLDHQENLSDAPPRRWSRKVS
ncbi:hypothetical protein GPA10_15330 [Streptomyces sp. p1417]|uniref:Uncharacterized protein n=1 Tax=Streptomyces typhae TaxID=2681492 RepID=A0A6L6WWM6_9ACTN|nr:DUF6415 family natural product biosynthesis protein [Streptomyces typhae]MVO86088.1 hypothetical protein [Streptomyces typhae]